MTDEADEQLEADASRYRWLKQNIQLWCSSYESADGKEENAVRKWWSVHFPVVFQCEGKDMPTLDAAIDAEVGKGVDDASDNS